ncbi:MAG TPA: deaminase [Clostridia bacterium]|nr:deaminase [Clostridia bacterium]
MEKNQVEKFLKKACLLARRSGCLRAKVGCVIVKDNKILVSAYNEIFPHDKYCLEHGCLRDELKLGMGQSAERCRSIHSEARAVAKAAQKGISLKGASLISTYFPCLNCAKLIAKTGIKEIYHIDKHADSEGAKILKLSGIKSKRLVPKWDNPKARLRDTSWQK